MSDTTAVSALRSGGQVAPIIPTTINEVWQVSKYVLLAGLAPEALVKGKDGDAAAASITMAIMAGAELGLPPMVSLRSFTVINGKPALYGDGLINVVRRSGKVAYLRTGCDTRDGQMVGWCEAKRLDTGEEKRAEFSQAEAIRAGLWQTSGISPWYKYQARMLGWRAAGYCLRELFGDVLGGIRDEFEAREVAESDGMRDVTPQQRLTPPPAPPAPEEVEQEPFDLERFLAALDDDMALANSEATIIEAWDSYKVEDVLYGDDKALGRAIALRASRLVKYQDAKP